ncbi:MAG: hypothetical protein Q8O53_00165 [Candidatus Moranbacteria bacterium]|nr:hypothetical protein [Candidatus Moranbacteria bacterium]
MQYMRNILAGSTVPVCVVEPGGDSDLRWGFEKLRHIELAERCGLEPPNPSGIEQDKYDQYATYLLILASDKQVLAGCRLIDGGLTQITLPPQSITSGRHCELSRLLVCSTVRGSQESSIYLCSLYAKLLTYAFEEGRYDTVYLDVRAPLFRTLRSLFGETLEQIGEPTVHVKHKRRLKLVPACFSSHSKDAMWASLVRRVQLHTLREQPILTEPHAVRVA